MSITSLDTLQTRKTLSVNGKTYDYFSLKAVEEKLGDLSRLPFSLKILLENLLRNEDGEYVKVPDIEAFKDWLDNKPSDRVIKFYAESAAQDAKIIKTSNDEDGATIIYPNIVMDSHDDEVECAGALNLNLADAGSESISMKIPDVVGVKLMAQTDASIENMVQAMEGSLDKEDIDGKFVEFYGDGVECLSMSDRSKISSRVMGQGALCAFFPMDENIDEVMSDNVLLRQYFKVQGLLRDENTQDPIFTKIVEVSFDGS